MRHRPHLCFIAVLIHVCFVHASVAPTRTPTSIQTSTPTRSTTPSPTPSLSPTPTPEVVIEHIVQEHLINRYIKWHRQQRHQAPRLVLRFDEPHPGVGDRFLSLVTAFVMASFSDRVLLLDWIQPNSIFQFFLPTQIRDLKFKEEDRLEEQKSKSVYVCDRLCARPLSLEQVLRPEHFVIFSQGTTTNAHYLCGHFTRRHPQLALSRTFSNVSESLNNVPPKMFSAIFNAMLKPSPRLHQLLEERSSLLQRPFIGVHARLGTGLGEKGIRFPADLSPMRIASCLASPALQIGKKYGVHDFYLATDTVSFRDIFEKVLKKKNSKANMIRFDDIVPVHTKGCQLNITECFNTMIELVLLSKSKHIVAIKSSFSKAAGYIGNVTVDSQGFATQCVK
ncbi:unnamed protein product [Agarophyton chilense]|eukprot:gb/GEZJ01002727.1/.p1 GENE.gb/GEZJ01002727.1/~~gb/GEZJ01002727.1/.p1  ORF type:complete len:393 (-),score=33.55 gb/GEZJ01002727.1/:360-1538(-)